jgi:hypothetical protein
MHKITVAGSRLFIDPGDMNIAQISYGNDETNPLYERTNLMVNRYCGFYLVGGGGSLTVWKTIKDGVLDMDRASIPLSNDDAIGWAECHSPKSVYWVALIARELDAHAERYMRVEPDASDFLPGC